MTEELLSEVVGKMNEACEGTECEDTGKGKMRFVYDNDPQGEFDAWWIQQELYTGFGKYTLESYSPILSIGQLANWCEAWLKGFEEAKAAYEGR